MRLSIKRLLGWIVRHGAKAEEEEDRLDAEYIQKCKNDTFRPLREVLADIEAEERVELRCPAKQPS
jgi:hypothetical protein